MKTFIRKNILIGIFLLGSTSFTVAAPALPVSSQVTEEKIEVVPEIKIEAQVSNTASNPKLKEGSACSDENLEEVKGELFSEIPMAKTMPCDKVDCSDLLAAQMHRDNYIKLKTAKTISCEK